MNVEAIYQKLFTRASAAAWSALSVGGASMFVTASRKFKFIDDCQPEELPALFQRQHTAQKRQIANQPANWLLRVELIVYVTTLAQQDGDIVPSQLLNVIFSAINTALEPQSEDRDPLKNTLGGLVYECKIEGIVEYFEGVLGDRGVLSIPVEITVPF